MKKRTTLQQLDHMNAQRAVYTIDKLRFIKSITSIEGCIGTGKSTFLDHMIEWARNQGRDAQTITCDSPTGDYYLFVGEPVGPWTDPIYHTGHYGDDSIQEGQPILEMYYDDPKNVAFPFQIFAFTTRICAIRDALSGVDIVGRIVSGEIRIHVVCERSLYTDALFMYCQYLLRNVNAMQLEVYTKLHSTTCDALLAIHTGMVYVQTPLDICAVRIKERNRVGEKAVSIPYQTILEQRHDIMADDFERVSDTHRVYRIDARRQMTHGELAVVVHDLMMRIDRDIARLQ